MIVERGQIWYADLSPVIGSEQGGTRPVVVLQNDSGNRHAPTTIIAALTTREKADIPTHCRVTREAGIPQTSVILAEQLRTIDKRRLHRKIGQLTTDQLNDLNNALIASLGIW